MRWRWLWLRLFQLRQMILQIGAWRLREVGGNPRPTPLQTHDSARAVATTCTHTNASLHNPISLGAALTAEEPPERNVVMRHVSSGRGLTKYERGVDEVKAIMMAG